MALLGLPGGPLGTLTEGMGKQDAPLGGYKGKKLHIADNNEGPMQATPPIRAVTLHGAKRQATPPLKAVTLSGVGDSTQKGGHATKTPSYK